MKLSQETVGRSVTLFVSGEVHGRSCNCLEQFWERHVDSSAQVIRLDASGVTSIDADGARILVGLLTQSAVAGAAVSVVSPPKLVADMIRNRDCDDSPARIALVSLDPAGDASA